MTCSVCGLRLEGNLEWTRHDPVPYASIGLSPSDVAHMERPGNSAANVWTGLERRSSPDKSSSHEWHLQAWADVMRVRALHVAAEL